MKQRMMRAGARVRSNWKAGLTVALVSLPLSVSLAVASGATPTMGIITAVWAGFFSAYFGGSHFNIVGPTGALVGILASYAAVHGAGSLPMLAITTGAIALLAWAFKLDRFIRMIPEHTVHGFTIGVAATIAATQLGNALGIAAPASATAQFAKIAYYVTHALQANGFVVIVFLAFLIGLFVLKKLTPSIPGAILLSPLGILVGYLAHHGLTSRTLPVLGDMFPNILPKLAEKPELFLSSSLIVPALGLAVIGMIETGISAKIADRMTGTEHNTRKEVFGLALGNIASGIFGGIPATAALARTSLNVKSGASHKASGMINAVWIVVISLVFLSFFTYIPMAVIAAILVYVAYQLIERDMLAHSWRTARKQFFIILIVAAVALYKDTMWAIALGVLIHRLGLGYERLASSRRE